MKKMMLALCLGLAAAAAVAGDVYDITMTCRVPEIKLGQKYYKDIGKQAYKGWMEVTYDDDGSVSSNGCDVVVYGKFNGVKTVKVVKMDVDIFNRIGKDLSKFEFSGTCDFGDFVITCAGDGKTAKASAASDPCVSGCDLCGTGCDPVPCQVLRYPSTCNGSITGWIKDVCSPCGGATHTYDCNICDDVLVEVPFNQVNGTWKLRYNKSLTKACAATDFIDCVTRKLPKGYSLTVE